MEKEKNDNPIYQYNKAIAAKVAEEVPIRRGCKNAQCFCSGQCQEIVGWRPKTAEEIRDEQRKQPFHGNN